MDIYCGGSQFIALILRRKYFILYLKDCFFYLISIASCTCILNQKCFFVGTIYSEFRK